jgi:hypothetical protein
MTLLLGVVMTVRAAPAMAENGWAAAYAGQCCYMTLEAGQVSPPQWFDARNTGTQTWRPSGSTITRLGTAAPHDKVSAFYDPGSWEAVNRAARIGAPSVPPGQTGRFAFRVRAPQTSGTFDAHFAPVADGPGGGWMDDQAGWSNVFLTYTVRPAVAPTVNQFGVNPSVVRPGEGISIAVQATDNVAIDHVTVSIGGNETTLPVPYEPPYASAGQFAGVTQLDTAGLGVGEHTVIAQAVDKLGQADTAAARILIRPAAAAAGPGATQGKGKRKRRVGPYIASFKWHAESYDAPRVVEKITLLPAPKGATGTVFCHRGCSLPYSAQRSRRGMVVFQGGALAQGVVVQPGAVIETRLVKDGVGRYRIYDAQLDPRKGGCLVRRDGGWRRTPCGG